MPDLSKAADMTSIRVDYTSLDGAHHVRHCSTIQEASEFARHWIGARPAIGYGYAISDDGIGKIEVTGASLRDLFPEGL